MFSPIGGARRFPLVSLQRVLVAATVVVAGTASVHAQSFSGQQYSSGTTASTAYATYNSLTQNTTVNFSTTQTSASGTRTLGSNQWFEYNMTGTDGAAVNPGGGYPTGYQFTSNLVASGTGAAGTANVTFKGATNGTVAGNTWIKGSGESGGNWNVRAGQPSFLGGYTNGSNTGTATLDLGGEYTSFSTLIGTNPSAILNIQVQGFDTNSATPGTALFTYTMNGIQKNTGNPYFTGYVGTTNFNRIIITGLATSTPAGNATYTAYPNAAYIELDQVRVGNKVVAQAVPEVGAAALLLPAGLMGLVSIGVRRSRKS